MPNRLADERSPYLLQHAGNPVDWYPWGEAAFERARREDKPIFLSVGYSTCHWCHVMEHESFESAEIAEVLNQHFVSIKVDREERPDIDRVYMHFVQATTGSGGWPMSVWLTTDLKPFYGGTYLPPSSKWGRPGFVDVLRQIARVWETERSTVLESATLLVSQLQEAHRSVGPAAPGERTIASADTLRDGVAQFKQTFDRTRGGFGGAPKFPRPAELMFLLREHARTGDPEALAMTLATLRAMALGGMRDHLGGGFHRYSVDAEWRVPHFEKMLYDQAQLVLAYLEAAQASGDAFFAAVAEDTLDYVRRDMTDPGGGFYSAEDADSVPPEHADNPEAHRSEGAFFIWSQDEIEQLLGGDADLFKRRFGVKPHGNAPHDPQGEFIDRNLLYVAEDIEDVADAIGRSPDATLEALGRARQVLFDARARRPRPRLDDKILTAWNGLMIAAFARAARSLAVGSDAGARPRAERYAECARRAASFIRASMYDEATGTLRRRYRDGEAAIDGYAEDYACLIWGLVELFEADGDVEWLRWALRLQQRQDELFWDEDEGGWFSTTGRDPSVLMRLKEDYDGAEPSASSVSVLNLLVLSHLTGDPAQGVKVERTLARFGPSLGRAARAVPLMAAVLSTFHAGLQQIVIVGPPDADATRTLLEELGRRYLPFGVLVRAYPAAQPQLAELIPFVGSMTMRNGLPTAYVCRDFACQEPVNDLDGLRRVMALE